ncbi:hypothetical protein CVT24_012542 [Panaeolus cyanescens]|uniref:N-acetyltransferase domain-containing protein n=1 Tax=Panaeolus cyanescens TaxID=181874 RepID=A0A409W619_9AGAR|nr:hypothetical protein CVT24_012542 [Panaeolus cyanescens]
MLSEELRTLTASEPLSLGEEYEMQSQYTPIFSKWQNDPDKLTFIILARKASPLSTSSAQTDSLDATESLTIRPNDPRLQQYQMIGDVNIFLSGPIPIQGSDQTIPQETTDKKNENGAEEEKEDDEEEFHAEAEIMIAEPSFRRKGFAVEALQLMLGYATGQPDAFVVPGQDSAFTPNASLPPSPLNIPPSSLLVKIGDTNHASIKLFQKLGFEIVKRVEVFQEVEMRWQKSL